MLVASVLNTLLSRYCYQEDIVIGFPISGRSEQKFEKIVGLFINTLVLRTKISTDESFLSLLQQVKEIVLNLILIKMLHLMN